MKITICDMCDLPFDETAYGHHLRSPCIDPAYDGPLPMLTCTLHGPDCLYNDAKWRAETGSSWTEKGRECRPIYMTASHRDGLYLTLHRDVQEGRQKAPRLPPKKEVA